MNEQQLVDQLNAQTPKLIKILGGRIAGANPAEKTCTMDFDISRDFCHSNDIVQGGFVTAMLDAVVTAMLDAAMTHAAFAADKDIVNVSSLEIKTNFLEPTRAGHSRAVGEITKSGYKLAFIEGRLYDENCLLTATASTVAKLMRKR